MKSIRSISRLALAITTIGLCGLAAPALAESDATLRATTAPRRGGAGFVTAGWRSIDLGSLPTALGRSGYGHPGSDFFGIGGGGQAMLGRWVVGGEGQFLVGDRTGGIELTGGFGMGRLGYAIVQTDRLSIYPLLGVGGGGLTLLASAESGGKRRETELSMGGMLLDGTLAADYRIPMGRSGSSEGFLLVGMRAGYTFSPLQTEWASDEGELKGPQLSFSGPSLRLIVGFGGRGVEE